jgi:hypothetical protein
LTKHPEVEVVSRDRYGHYAQGEEYNRFKNALTERWSNGQTEPAEALKRVICASIELLRAPEIAALPVHQSHRLRKTLLRAAIHTNGRVLTIKCLTTASRQRLWAQSSQAYQTRSQ